MREIPSLQVLCLRAVGSKSCSAEATFAKGPNGELSMASRLLRSFSQNAPSTQLQRTPCVGVGSCRRVQANEVDLFHPFLAERLSSKDMLVSALGSAATDCLQSYVDVLVDLGRMDDNRLGVHFFEEWKANVLLADTAGNNEQLATTLENNSNNNNNSSTRKQHKRQRREVQQQQQPPVTAFGSLTFYNCTIALDTFESMVAAKIGPHLAMLDLTGVRGLTDDLLHLLLPTCPNLIRLSVKNCRRITQLTTVTRHCNQQLVALDIGGAFNLTTSHVLEQLASFPRLTDLHASGLGWTNEALHELGHVHVNWRRLSINFCTAGPHFYRALQPFANSLQSLAVAFCADVDNVAVGWLGRNLPHVTSLDVRGNQYLTTLTGWYDGRASADLPVQQSLTVLGRYSGLSEKSVDETKVVHPVEAANLVVFLDGEGTGAGIHVKQDNEKEGE
jgi:hypothetical protein